MESARQLLIAGALCLALPTPAAAAPVRLPRTDGEVTIDGSLEESVWKEALRVDLTVETEPGENLTARVETAVYLVEDGESLFVAFDAKDPEPEAIRAYLRDRDSAWDDDHVGIIIDTYNDERRAFQFLANPFGVQMDLTRDDTGAGNEFDDSWDAIWDSAGQINGDGYVVEMRIPLSQLRFPAVDGEKTWGYDLERIYPRDRTYRLSNNHRDRNRNCYLCQVGKLQGLEGSEPSSDLEIVPTLTASQVQTTEDPAIEPLPGGDFEAEAGLTVRWGISPDLTANLAINPDFSQIESDVAQVDVNNRFALFFPEKRPFFLEGANYFSTPIDAVFTRTVADPEAGAKLTGSRGRHTFGVFAARDRITNLLFPGPLSSDTGTLEQANDAFVGRYSFGFDNASSVGALVTLREGAGYHNYVGGLDGRWRINDQHSIELQHLRSDSRYPLDIASEFGQPLADFSGDATRLAYHFDSRDWFGNVRYFDFGSGFRADAGFVTQVGGRVAEAAFGRIWHGADDDWWTTFRVWTDQKVSYDEADQMIERENALRFAVGGPWQSWFQVAIVDARERFDSVLYDMFKFRVYYEFQPTGGVSLAALGAVSEQIDYDNGGVGDEIRFEPRVNWNVTRNLFLRFRGFYVGLDTKQGEKIFEAIIADTRLTWQFNVRSFIRLTVQNRDVERNQAVYLEPVDARSKSVGRQLLYSYKLNPQTVFFVGYSDQYVDEDNLDGLTISDRTWFLKVGYAWLP